MSINGIRLLILCLFTMFDMLYCKSTTATNIDTNMYWEDISPEIKKKVINSIDNKLILDFYNKNEFGKKRLNDDGNADILLDSLVNYSNFNKAFYFYIFNRICLSADGAVSEMLGDYCIRIFIKDPEYTFNYLVGHKDLFELYASFMGSEFYFKEDGSSDIVYSYFEFKKIILKSGLEEDGQKNQLNEFFKTIERVMRSMD